MALCTTYATKETLWPFWFGTPDDYPHVLVLFCHAEALWAVSSNVHKTPMAGIEIQTHPGQLEEPDISGVLQVGYSDWFVSANDSASSGVQIFSLLFSGAHEDSPNDFERVFDIESRTLRSQYDLDADPDHVPKLPNPRKDRSWHRQGELVFSGTNFILVPYFNDCSGAAMLACVDTTEPCRPAWVIDHSTHTLFFPDYATNRPINRRFRHKRHWWTHLTGWRLFLFILVVLALVLLALWIVPVTRCLLWDVGAWVLETTSQVVYVQGYPPPQPLVHRLASTSVSAVQRVPYYYIE